jgi:methyl-accepting chemotaxis protein
VSEETFRWVVAGGVVIAAVFFAVMGMTSLALLMFLKRLMERLEPILKAANPIAQNAQELVAIVKPRILKMSSDATEVSGMVVTEARRYAEISKDVGERAKIKIARFDGAVDETVEQMQEASGAVKSAVRKPFQHIEGVVAGVRTAIHTYANGGSGRNNMYGASQYRAAQDEEMFI